MHETVSIIQSIRSNNSDSFEELWSDFLKVSCPYFLSSTSEDCLCLLDFLNITDGIYTEELKARSQCDAELTDKLWTMFNRRLIHAGDPNFWL